MNTKTRVDAMLNEEGIDVDDTNNYNIDECDPTIVNPGDLITDEKDMLIRQLRE